MSKKSSIVDQSNLTEAEILINSRLRSLGKKAGAANGDMMEPVPTIEVAPCENIRRGKNNAFVILGRDRPSHRDSGFGGRGASQCGRIDLIAGLASSYTRKDKSNGPPNKETIISPNFGLDASRIYISQKAHIDKYMGIAETPGIDNSNNRSAIGIKSDCVRIHGRHDVKIVTGRARLEGLGKKGELLSTGGDNKTGVGSISLIAGNYTDDEIYSSLNLFNPMAANSKKRKLQPIPKGDNLIEALSDLCDILLEVTHRVQENSRRIDTLGRSYQQHIHEATPGFGGPSTPSFSGMIGATFLQVFTNIDRVHLKLDEKKINTWKKNFINDFGSPKYISSKHVFTT